MKSSTLNTHTLAQYFDHTFLKAFATEQDLRKLCLEAKTIGAAMVAINTEWISFCKEQLKDSNVHVGAAIGFPLGQCGTPVKVYETQYAIAQGADEIDYVVNLSNVKQHRWDLVEDEMWQITSLCKEHHVIVKVIFENCYLEKDEIKKLAEIAKKVQPDFIKTSTGFGTGGALLEDVALMIETVEGKVKVKAAGRIRDLKTAKAMIDLGVERIGTSASLHILEELKREQA